MNDNDYWDDDYFITHYGLNDGGGNCPGGCSGGVFKFTIIVIGVIIILALLLGVGIPGAVWGFFGKVILLVGFFAFLGSIGGKK